MRLQRVLLVASFVVLAAKGTPAQTPGETISLGTNVTPTTSAAATSDQESQVTWQPGGPMSPALEQPTLTTVEGESGSSTDDLARCGGPCPTKHPSPSPLRPICPGGCPHPPKPTYCDECPSPTYTYTPPPIPPRPTCDSNCPITTTIPPPPVPTKPCPPRPDCKSVRYKRFYDFGHNSGSGLVRVLLKGYEDCADVDSTVRILQDKAPSSPSFMDSSPSLYCRQLGVYSGYLDAVDVFEDKCTVRCRDDGKQIGAEAAYLLCNLPTARIARFDICEISYDAGCALAFEATVRNYCPSELNSERYNAVKRQVCAFKG